jgi:hypothetical protein
MINVAVLEAVRSIMATDGAALVAEMSVFLPAVWPSHRYSEETPDGAFIEGEAIEPAPHHPDHDMRVPDWTYAAGSEDFAITEGEKLDNFRAFIFTSRNLFWVTSQAVGIGDVFQPFGRRADRTFESGKFPRDQWKAGSFDVDLWARLKDGIARSALNLLDQIDELNDENFALTPHEWLVSKLVEGPLVDDPGTMDSTFADVPLLLEDIEDWEDEEAYRRVGEFVSSGDPAWTAAQISFAFANSLYGFYFSQLSSGRWADDFFDSCITLWRTGSQTRQRDSYT